MESPLWASSRPPAAPQPRPSEERGGQRGGGCTAGGCKPQRQAVPGAGAQAAGRCPVSCPLLPRGSLSVPTMTPLQRLTFDEGSGWGVNSPSSAWTDRQMAGDTVVGQPDLSCGPFRPSPPGLPALPFTVDKGTCTPGCGVGSCVHCGWAPRWAAGPLCAGRPPGPAPPRATLALARPGSPDCPGATQPVQAPCEAHHQSSWSDRRGPVWKAQEGLALWEAGDARPMAALFWAWAQLPHTPCDPLGTLLAWALPFQSPGSWAGRGVGVREQFL